MVIYFMRHTAVDVPQGVCYGQTDVQSICTGWKTMIRDGAHLLR